MRRKRIPGTAGVPRAPSSGALLSRSRMFSSAIFGISIALISAIHPTKLQDFAGTWVMKFGERNLLVLKLVTEGEVVHGSLEYAEFELKDSIISNVRGIPRGNVSQARLSDGVLHLIVQDAGDPKDEVKFSMTVNGDRAELTLEDPRPGAVRQPHLLQRGPSDARMADWEPNRAYGPNDSDVPSAEMTAIYVADQQARGTAQIDWEIVGRVDAVRREQTRRLLSSGALHTGVDYEHAAYVFQHGASAADYLLAHTLAMVAVSKGDSVAIWIAAATMDRYLQKIGQKQILGTQFSKHSEHDWSQEPYDRDLISDALRQQLGVPTQAGQAQQLKAYQDQK
jgi:hypothetical protein